MHVLLIGTIEYGGAVNRMATHPAKVTWLQLRQVPSLRCQVMPVGKRKDDEELAIKDLLSAQNNKNLHLKEVFGHCTLYSAAASCSFKVCISIPPEHPQDGRPPS